MRSSRSVQERGRRAGGAAAQQAEGAAAHGEEAGWRRKKIRIEDI